MTDATNPSAKTGEPVAWRHRRRNHVRARWVYGEQAVSSNLSILYETEPLYTHSQPSLSAGLDREAVARCIIGPRRPVPVTSPYTLEELRDEMWERARADDKADALNAAEAILSLAAPAEGYVLVPVERLRDLIYSATHDVLPVTVCDVTGIGTKARAQMQVDIADKVIAACLPAAPTGETGASEDWRESPEANRPRR